MSVGTLYIVATPIGNLEDITIRALAVLSSVDLILCEDTRVTSRLLERYNINTPMLSLNARTEKGKIPHVLKLLEAGKSAAYVTDAGTPGISDPGELLVASIRVKLPEANIVTVPGASALTAAISISGVPSAEFVFLGFLPHKKGRETLFKEIAASKRTMVFYESPHRIMKTLEKLSAIVEPLRKVVIARELTKVFEQVVSGSAQEVLTYFTENNDKQRGEYVVIIAPSR